MQSIKGVVKALSKYGKGFALEGTDGWFTSYKESDVEGAVVGATVEFKYQTKANPKGADYLNIQGQVNVVSAAPAAQAQSKGSAGGGTNKQFRTVEELNRIDGLRMAIDMQSAGALTLPTDNKEALIALILLGMGVSAYIDGRFTPTAAAATQAANEEVKPEPEPEPEPTPAPAPVVASSSLDDFMSG